MPASFASCRLLDVYSSTVVEPATSMLHQSGESLVQYQAAGTFDSREIEVDKYLLRRVGTLM